MPAAVVFTLTEHQLGDIKTMLILVLAALVGVYDRRPTWL